MPNNKIKTKLNQLLQLYEGGKVERCDALAKDLHIKRRWLTYLLNGEKTPGFFLAREIEFLHSQKIK